MKARFANLAFILNFISIRVILYLPRPYIYFIVAGSPAVLRGDKFVKGFVDLWELPKCLNNLYFFLLFKFSAPSQFNANI